jgi:hypothetical protein
MQNAIINFLCSIDQTPELTDSKILKNLLQKLNTSYTQHLNKVSIYKDDKMLYKVRNVYINFLNFKILKQIKLELKEKIKSFFDSLKILFDNLTDLKDNIINKIKNLFSLIEKLPSIIYKFQSFINNENNLLFEMENFVLDYSFSKVKTYISSYMKIYKFNKEIEINGLIAKNKLEMMRSFFKYFYPERFNTKIINNVNLKNIIMTKLNTNKEGVRYAVLDDILVISPQIQVNLDDVILTQVNHYKTTLSFYELITDKFAKCKFSLYDNDIHMTGRFIHFAERKGKV